MSVWMMAKITTTMNMMTNENCFGNGEGIFDVDIYPNIFHPQGKLTLMLGSSSCQAPTMS